MSSLLHDKEVTYHKYRHQWMQQQNKLRQRLKVEDDFDWSLPRNCVQIQYQANSDYGRCTKSVQNSSLNHSKRGLKRTLKYIGGVDISFAKPGAFEYDKACAGLTIYEFPSMKCVHKETAIVTLKHPYIAGFLAFREVEHLKQLFFKVKRERPKIVPDVILVDGNGILHYRRMGLATHLSMDIGIPCIGVAKKLLAIDHLQPDILVPKYKRTLKAVGSFYKIRGSNSKLIGRNGVAFALRTYPTGDVVYVSPGNRISLETSLKVVMLSLVPRHRLPLPIEVADRVTRDEIRIYQSKHGNPYSINNRRPRGGGHIGFRGRRGRLMGSGRSDRIRNIQTRGDYQQRDGRPIQNASEQRRNQRGGKYKRGSSRNYNGQPMRGSNSSNRGRRSGTNERNEIVSKGKVLRSKFRFHKEWCGRLKRRNESNVEALVDSVPYPVALRTVRSVFHES